MKHFILIAAMFVTTSAFAEVLLSVENPRIEVTHGPQMAAVQPYAEVVFEFSSCGGKKFSAVEDSRLSSGKVTAIKLVPSTLADCRALPVKRTYRVQVTSDYQQGSEYIVLNPIPTNTRR